MIDGTITAGNIIEIVALVIGGLFFLLNQNAINTRMSNLEENFRELKHGRGFIHDELNGEWNKRGKVK